LKGPRATRKEKNPAQIIYDIQNSRSKKKRRGAGSQAEGRAKRHYEVAHNNEEEEKSLYWRGREVPGHLNYEKGGKKGRYRLRLWLPL